MLIYLLLCRTLQPILPDLSPSSWPSSMPSDYGRRHRTAQRLWSRAFACAARDTFRARQGFLNPLNDAVHLLNMFLQSWSLTTDSQAALDRRFPSVSEVLLKRRTGFCVFLVPFSRQLPCFAWLGSVFSFTFLGGLSLQSLKLLTC